MSKTVNKKKAAKVQPDFRKEFLPGVAIDMVIFGFHESQLKILLLQYENTGLFGLPAGFIRREENLNDAAKRILLERTSLTDIYLDQFYAFGDVTRHDKEPMKAIMQAKGTPVTNDHFLLDRFISVGYYALVDYTKAIPASDMLADSCEWHDMAALPKLMLDHEAIISKALSTLRENLDKKLIGFNLLPDTFTMGDLQCLYETILGQKTRRTSFQRKILNLNILERISKKMTGGAHKAPYLYRFSEKATDHSA